MNRLTAALLAVGLASSSAAAFAQSSTYYPPSNGYNANDQSGSYTDYARVIRVDPVLDGRYGTASSYGTSALRLSPVLQGSRSQRHRARQIYITAKS